MTPFDEVDPAEVTRLLIKRAYTLAVFHGGSPEADLLVAMMVRCIRDRHIKEGDFEPGLRESVSREQKRAMIRAGTPSRFSLDNTVKPARYLVNEQARSSRPLLDIFYPRIDADEVAICAYLTSILPVRKAAYLAMLAAGKKASIAKRLALESITEDELEAVE